MAKMYFIVLLLYDPTYFDFCRKLPSSLSNFTVIQKAFLAWSKSVGVTCGIATQLLLDGHKAFNIPGVLASYNKEICDPIRNLVEKEGIKMVEQLV